MMYDFTQEEVSLTELNMELFRDIVEITMREAEVFKGRQGYE